MADRSQLTNTAEQDSPSIKVTKIEYVQQDCRDKNTLQANFHHFTGTFRKSTAAIW
jgi:hypothetical protein